MGLGEYTIRVLKSSELFCYELWFRRPMLFARRVFMRLIVYPIWWVIQLFIKIIRSIVLLIVKILMIPIWPIIKLIEKINKINIKKYPLKIPSKILSYESYQL